MNLTFPREEHRFQLAAPAGELEVWATTPKTPVKNIVTVICHPHPGYGGTMSNKVITTLAKAFHHLGIKTVRFNFRGIGKSTGEYGAVTGEIEDLNAVLDWVQSVLPQDEIWLAGFSFGSYITAFVSQHRNIAELISVAPPVHHFPFDQLSITCPWLIIQGDQDEIVSAALVYQFIDSLSKPPELLRFPDATHFFHGQLVLLGDAIERHFAARFKMD